MKMVMAVVPANVAEQLLDALINHGHTATYAETHGGMLRQSQKSLFIAVQKDLLQDVLKIIKENCHTRVEMSTRGMDKSGFDERPPVTANLGGAVVFVWDIMQLEIY